MREEADLDALITRIQSDLRAGRGPRETARGAKVSERDVRFRAELREIRGRSLKRADLTHLAGRWLAPVLIFLTVLAATLLFDRP